MFGLFRKRSASAPPLPSGVGGTPRKHHLHFTHDFIPQGAAGEKSSAFVPALANAAQQQALGLLWTKFGEQIVSAKELVAPAGLEAHVFRIAGHVAILFIFPAVAAPGESIAGVLVVGPVSTWPPPEGVQLPSRYFVMDRGSEKETRIQEWSAAGYRDCGPGPAADAIGDFSDAVLHKICGLPEEGE